MGSTKSGEKVVERLLVGEIDRRQAGAELVFVSLENVVLPYGGVEQVAGCDAGRIVVVVLRAGSGNL